jgi:hypothetical protein
MPPAPASTASEQYRIEPSEHAPAWVALAAVVLACCTLVAIALSPWRSGFADAPRRAAGDVALYMAEAERIRNGEPYYSAVRAELQARGYPTASVFNWRTPLPVWLVGVLPPHAGQCLIAAIAVGVLLVSGHVVARQAGLPTALLTLVCLSGALLPVALAGPYIMPEVWSGVLIAASLLCYGIERRGPAVVLGAAALFLRELAAPYCLVCGVLAIRERRWREVLGWLASAGVYLAFYVWHLRQVAPLIAPNARSHAEGWLQFGGAAFVLSIVQLNAYLLLLPQWVSGVYLALSLLGFTRLSGDWGRRAAWTACLYLVAFGTAGQAFNQYWGALLAPLFCYGAAHGMAALPDLWRQARGDATLSTAP